VTKSIRNPILASLLLSIGVVMCAMPRVAVCANLNLANPFKAGPAAKSIVVSSSMSSVGALPVFSGNRSAYTITRISANSVTVKQNTSQLTETFAGPVRFTFSDMNVAWSEWQQYGGVNAPSATDGPAQIYRLYHAAFNRKPDLAGIGYWIKCLDNGATLDQVAIAFGQSAEMGNLTNEQFLDKVHSNLFNTPMPASVRANWISNFELYKNTWGQGYPESRGRFLAFYSELEAHRLTLHGEIMHGIDYQPAL
jgi:hypothetical protein